MLFLRCQKTKSKNIGTEKILSLLKVKQTVNNKISNDSHTKPLTTEYIKEKIQFTNTEAVKTCKVINNTRYFLLMTSVNCVSKYLVPEVLEIIQVIIKKLNLKQNIPIEIIYDQNNKFNLVKVFTGKKVLTIFGFQSVKHSSTILLSETGLLFNQQIIQLSKRIGLPCKNTRITSPYGYRVLRDKKNHHKILKKSFHRGIDIGLPMRTPIYSSCDGKVVLSKYLPHYGKVIHIQHANHFVTLYAHLDKISVKQGQYVKAGQIIGLSGKSGFVTGPHLHFEVRHKKNALNPCHKHLILSKLEASDCLVKLHIKHHNNIYKNFKSSIHYK